jgi:tRNA-binding protein
MLAIFYNKTALNDTLIINVNDNETVSVKEQGNFVYGSDNKDEITFINIFKFSQYLELPEGYLTLTPNLHDLIREKINADLSKYNVVQPFIVGKVIECDPITDTHLHICKVNIEQKVLIIVCGANNIRKDLLVVVAQVGATLPNGLMIKRSKLMGHDSQGMICSARELNLSAQQFNSNGIIELPNHFTVGENFMEVFDNFTLKK